MTKESTKDIPRNVMLNLGLGALSDYVFTGDFPETTKQENTTKPATRKQNKHRLPKQAKQGLGLSVSGVAE